MSFVIDKTVTDKPPKKTVVSQFIGNNSINLPAVTCNNMSTDFCKRYDALMTVCKNISLRYVHCLIA